LVAYCPTGTASPCAILVHVLSLSCSGVARQAQGAATTTSSISCTPVYGFLYSCDRDARVRVRVSVSSGGPMRPGNIPRVRGLRSLAHGRAGVEREVVVEEDCTMASPECVCRAVSRTRFGGSREGAGGARAAVCGPGRRPQGGESSHLRSYFVR